MSDYISTREAARLAGVEPHVLYSNFKRHGNYCGVVPTKGDAGRLSWPAEELRIAVLPPEREWPEAAWLFIELAHETVPEASQRDLYRLASAWLGSAWTPGWQPLPGQLDERRLEREAAMLGMMVQALGDRAGMAKTAPSAALTWLARVVHNALRYLTDDTGEGSASNRDGTAGEVASLQELEDSIRETAANVASTQGRSS